MKNRESNYELLRIVSMFLIVLYHVIFHGNVLVHTAGILQILFQFILLFTLIHVNVFILIMGYFQSKAKFKIKKVISILLQVWFYNILVNGVLKCFNIVEYTNIEFLNAISPFNLNSYWFIYCYLIMYMLSPFINIIIEKADRITLKKVIILLICIFGIIPYATFGLAWGYNIYSIEQFILIYFIGAYIRKYDIDKKIMRNISLYQKRLACIGIFISGLVLNFVLYLAKMYMETIDSNTLQFLGNGIGRLINSYSNPILIIQSIAIFILFGTYCFKSKVINYISGLTLGVYLIHDGWYARYSIYKLLKIDTGNMLYGMSQTVKVMAIAIFIFVVGLMIEFIRQMLLKLIYKIKIVKKTSDNFVGLIEKVIEINK